MSNLFISHSSKDAEAAKALKNRLAQHGHRSVFLDLDPDAGIQAGVSWERTLYTKLRACRAVVALCSDTYVTSQWCFAEIALARMEGKEIFVLKIDPWSEDTDLPSILQVEQFIDMRTDPEDGYHRLFNGFDVKGITPSEQRDWRPNDPPYPGLRAFHAEDAPIFFGRDAEIQESTELLNQMARQGHPRLAMVLGSSGSGKSSLVRAGVVPRLMQDAKSWTVVPPFRPGTAPLRELSAVLSQALDGHDDPVSWQDILSLLETDAHSDTPDVLAPDVSAEAARDRLFQALSLIEGEIGPTSTMLASVQRLREYLDEKTQTEEAVFLRTEPNALVDVGVRLQLAAKAPDAPVILVIDQFEELLGHDAGHPASHFLSMLRAALETESCPFLVIGTMRSDFLGLLQAAPAMQGLGRKTVSVGPMARAGMRQVIEEPAKLGQLDLENGLTDILLDDTETSDALPLLAFTLRLLWDRYHAKRRIEIGHYRDLDGLQGAIAGVAEQTYLTALDRQDGDAARDAAARQMRDAFLAMVRPSAEGAGWSRNPVDWDSLPEEVRPLLDPFVDPQRLLVRRKDGTVEVAHEALFRSWDTLRQWLDENAEALHLLHEIGIEAQKWGDAPDASKPEYLWTGGRLARARELRGNGVLALEQQDKAFIDASTCAEQAAAEEKERRRQRELRRTRIFAGVVSLALMIAVGLGILAWIERNRAEEQTRVAKRSFKMSLVERYALDFAYGPKIARELDAAPNGWNAIVADQIRARPATHHWIDTPGAEQEVEWVSMGPGGQFATAHADGKIWLWQPDGDGLAQPRLLGQSDAPLWGVRFAASGTVVASSDRLGVVKLWTTEGDAPARTLTGTVRGDGLRVRISQNAQTIALLQEDGWEGKRSVTVWDLSSPDPRRLHLDAQTVDDVRSLAVSPDGTRVLLGTGGGDVLLWSIFTEDGPVSLPPSDPQPYAVVQAEFDQTGQIAVVSDDTGQIVQWDLTQPERAGASRYTRKKIYPDSMRVVDGRIFIASDDTVYLLALDDLEDVGPFIPEFFAVSLLDIDFDGKRMVTALKNAKGAWSWRIDAPENPHVLEPPATEADRIARHAVYLDDQTLLAAYACGTLRLWSDVATGGNAARSKTLIPAQTDGCDPEQAGSAPPPLTAFSVGGTGQRRYAMGFRDGSVAVGELLADGSAGPPRMIAAPAARPRISDDARCDDPGQPAPAGQNAIWSVAFDPSSGRLAAGFQDGAVRVLNVLTQQWAPPAEHAASPVCAVDWSASGDAIVSGGLDGTAVLWTPSQDGALMRTGVARTFGAINAASFDAAGTMFLTGGQSRFLELWTTATPDVRHQTVERYDAPIYAARFHPAGDRVLSGVANALITHCVDVPRDRQSDLCKADRKPVNITIPNRNSRTRKLRDVAFAPDGLQNAAIDISGELSLSRTDHMTALWQQRPQCLPAAERQRLFFETAPEAAAAFSACKVQSDRCQGGRGVCEGSVQD